MQAPTERLIPNEGGVLRKGVGSRFRVTINQIEIGLSENDSRSLRDSFNAQP
jgi:hypothetical protein